MINRLIVLIIVRLIDYQNNRLLQPYLYAPSFWNAPIFTKLIILRREACSDWPAIQCVVIRWMPHAENLSGGHGRVFNFYKEYLFGFETLVFATSVILSMHKQLVTLQREINI